MHASFRFYEDPEHEEGEGLDVRELLDGLAGEVVEVPEPVLSETLQKRHAILLGSLPNPVIPDDIGEQLTHTLPVKARRPKQEIPTDPSILARLA